MNECTNKGRKKKQEGKEKKREHWKKKETKKTECSASKILFAYILIATFKSGIQS